MAQRAVIDSLFRVYHGKLIYFSAVCLPFDFASSDASKGETRFLGSISCRPCDGDLQMPDFYARRLQIAASNFACLDCKNVLGVAAIELADTRWHEHIKEFRRKNPRLKYRVSQSVHAICTSCGKQYRYQRCEVRTRPFDEELVPVE
jgi:hypothetical protein